ncbi:hypothetical protein [Streptomyces sp. NEAU-YJ-81]|uniref:hypothetical protein n=1 Tax=Streptomyces sp. NEAU-YJ-81 TaxID=2820288 RepID=UPI001ABC1E6B|nr:hypothetical protein [Streptomyces sp. NEAU-YJ-81]MBO3681962.1 hypothetical protein [Streptomyces sp. NEAU-YJ-81]
MFLGALADALLFLHNGPSCALGPALLLLAVTAFATHRLSVADAAWIRPGGAG